MRLLDPTSILQTVNLMTRQKRHTGRVSLEMHSGLASCFFSSLNYRRKESLAKYSLGLAKPKLFEKKKNHKIFAQTLKRL